MPMLFKAMLSGCNVEFQSNHRCDIESIEEILNRTQYMIKPVCAPSCPDPKYHPATSLFNLSQITLVS